MSAYRLSGENWVTRLSDGARIAIANPPEAPNENPDFLAYIEWLEAGGVPEPADPSLPGAGRWPALIAARRYQAETGGISVNGMPLDTGRDSQALITGAAVSAMLDPDYSVRWKTQSGFVELTAEQIIGVASAVRAHVQACFDREAELLAALDDETFTPEMLEDGWHDESVPEPVAG